MSSRRALTLLRYILLFGVVTARFMMLFLFQAMIEGASRFYDELLHKFKTLHRLALDHAVPDGTSIVYYLLK